MMGTMVHSLWRPYRTQLAVSAALSTIEAATALALPWLAGLAIHELLTPTAGDVTTVAGLLLALLFLQAVLRVASRSISAVVSANLLADLRRAVFAHIQSLPIGYHTARKRGEILSLLTLDVSHLGNFVSGFLVQLVPSVLTALGAVICMTILDARLAASVLICIGLAVLGLKLGGRRLRALSQAARQTEAAAVAAAEEMLQSLPAIKASAAEPVTLMQYSQQLVRCRDSSLALARLNAALSPAVEFFTMTGAATLIAIAGLKFAGPSSTGQTVSFVLYAVLLTRPLSRLASSYGQFQMARGALQRLEEVLAVAAERAGGLPLVRPVRGAIKFENVSFAYPGRDLALCGFSLQVAAGETVALTGINGAGKSTLTHLLLGLYKLDRGRILIDGLDISEVDLRDLRRSIGLVPQVSALLNASVRENIAFGVSDASEADIQAAARLAHADQFIRTLPSSYDTIIGDQGVRLSGGQRQRIALARALLTDPPILVLDETTAMFDPEAERLLVDGLRALKGSRTILIITHRPASLALADRVVGVSEGQAIHLCAAA
jgi:ABC-type multidrug transport system fused ATPase/permease subunit